MPFQGSEPLEGTWGTQGSQKRGCPRLCPLGPGDTGCAGLLWIRHRGEGAGGCGAGRQAPAALSSLWPPGGRSPGTEGSCLKSLSAQRGLGLGNLCPLLGQLARVPGEASGARRWRRSRPHRSSRRPLHLGEEWACPGDVRAHADPRTARRKGPRAQLVARRHPGEHGVPLLRPLLRGEPDLQSAGHRDETW